MDFEQQKNVKAGTYTGVITGVLLLLCFMVSWKAPAPEIALVEDGMEVNLGDSETGFGEEVPMVPGSPAETETDISRPSPTAQAEPAATPKEVETDDEDKEAPPVVVPKPVKPKPVEKKIPPKEAVKKASNPKPVVTEQPQPAPRKPVALYKGGKATGTGGNDADNWNNRRNQGTAGGKGDQGKPGGNPDSDNYTGSGGSGNSGVSISKGLQGRRISRLPSFEDEFNENAKVAVDVKVDARGTVISVSYQPRGSTTSDAGMRSIALQKARQLKFTASDNGEESLGTIIFNFRLKN